MQTSPNCVATSEQPASANLTVAPHRFHRHSHRFFAPQRSVHHQVFAPVRSRPVQTAHRLRWGKPGRSLPSLGCRVPRLPAILRNVASAASFRCKGCITIRSSRCRFAARLNSGVIRGQEIDILALPQSHRPGLAGLRRKKQTARFGQHHVSAASLSSALGPIASSRQRVRCPSKSSPHCGLSPSRRRIDFGGANTAAHCRGSGAAFPGSRLSFTTLLPQLRFVKGAV